MNDSLAIRLRPNTLDEVIGQSHLLGDNKVLANLVKNNKLFSIILYGNPGIGKTTIALALVNQLKIKYRLLNAAINNKKDFDIVLEEAKLNGGLTVIVDEIHRMNKDKQDILLPALESNLITLIGLTSTNPYHTINKAIRSRVMIFELKSLTDEEMREGITKVKDVLPNISFEDEAINYIINIAKGDLRYCFNLIETSYYALNDNKLITLDFIKQIACNPNILSDKDEEVHYNLISALQKSIRGSDVDASLYYLARLLISGDLDIIFRRLTVIGYEDIGLANPSIGPKIKACIDACNLIGLPEAKIPLAVLVSEMALSPKSNSAYLAIDSVMNDINMNDTGNVPAHLHTSSPNYKYPHNYPNHYVKQQYLPDKIKNRKYYQPNLSNKYECNLYEGHKKITNLRD